MKLHRNELIAGIGTAVLMGLLCLFLVLFCYTAIVPQDENGLSVNFGNIDLSAGTFEPFAETPASQSPSQTPPLPSASHPQPEQDDLLTQADESVNLADEAKQREEEEAKRLEEERRKAEEAKRLEEERIRQEQERKRNEISNLAQNVFGTPSGSESSSQGTSDEAQSNQGAPQGSPDTDLMEKDGGEVGYSITLGDNRGLRERLESPQYSGNAEGDVEVIIKVNAQGEVVSADLSPRRTTTDDQRMREAAIAAARKAKFAEMKDVPLQTGTILYRFRVR